jgi:hypothetical protein
MVTPSVRGWVHHYIFTDYYLRDARTALMESEMRYLEKQHGPMIVHWTTPLMLGDDMIVIDEDSSEGGKV